MAVTYAERIPKKKGGRDNNEGTILKERYIITVSQEDDDQVDILLSNFAGLPQKGDPHPNNSSAAVVIDRVLIPTDSRLRWRMDLTYDDVGEYSAAGIIVNQVSIASWQESFILERDYNNKMIVDSAGSKIKYEATRPQPLVTFSAVTKDPTLWEFNESRGMVNNAPVTWLGFDFKIDQLMFDDYRATSIGNNVWREDFVFRGKLISDFISKGAKSKGLNPERNKGWQAQLLDAGFWELKDTAAGKQRVPIYVKQTQGAKPTTKPVTQPWPLKVGEALPIDKIDDQSDYIQFATAQKMNFNIFNFDFRKVFDENAEKKFAIK